MPNCGKKKKAGDLVGWGWDCTGQKSPRDRKTGHVSKAGGGKVESKLSKDGTVIGLADHSARDQTESG